ncbi:MAG: recombinase family protein [Oscillochloris sp.]|nr:recombinase family protein [Oscillochloris sp.]
MTPLHLDRKAVVYIRQSSPKQVREHLDSQLNQRALIERAQALGWHPERIEVLDGDLGQSAAHAQGREDFKVLAAEVALGHVGIVFGWDVSRLARNNADWYQLLDLAALFGTLIGDNDGVYDPRRYNDRLLLGLKGTLSEAELYMLRQRLNAGRLSKVQRGEYVQHLPTGLVRLADKRVIKDPDAQIRHVIDLVLAKFEELGSCRQVLRYCKRHPIALPRRQRNGVHPGQVVWRKPSEPAIREVLTNPAYAGAFVYGRRPTDPTRQQPGRRATGTVRKPMAEWQCIRQDAYPAFISWERYIANQARLRDNAQRFAAPAERGRGTPRQGAALLQGLAVCGHCGHHRYVCYRPSARYICKGLTRVFDEPMCAPLDGPTIEAFVITAFFEAIQPAQLDTLEDVLAQRRRDRDRLERHHQQQLQRARYEADLARQRYEHVDPAHRLVAGELERDWNDRLRAVREAQEAADRFAQPPLEPALTPALRQPLRHLSDTLPALWASGQLNHEQRKMLLRSLIARVILQRMAPDRVQVKIVWVSGHFSEGVVIPPIHRQVEVSGYDTMVARIEQLWRDGSTDEHIAATLSAEGFRSARSTAVSKATVLKIRNQCHWVSRYHQHRRAEQIDGMWTIHGLAHKLNVDRDWFYTRIKSGFLSAPDVIRKPPYGNYLIRNEAELIERLRREVNRTRRADAQPQT